jgi:hypothetical protein
MKHRRTVVVGILCMATLVGPVMGQTADGDTPVNEAICDDLFTATPGLYGLCIAYCEAMDCELVDDEMNCDNFPDPRILQKYRSRMQEGDPDMPCVVPGPCPCWTENEVNDIVPILPFPGPDKCNNDFEIGSTWTTRTALNYGYVWGHGFAGVEHNPHRPLGQRLYCRRGFGLDGSGAAGTPPVYRFAVLSEAEALICSAQLVARGQEHGGWTCW